jgi:hypothetical protein
VADKPTIAAAESAHDVARHWRACESTDGFATPAVDVYETKERLAPLIRLMFSLSCRQRNAENPLSNQLL